MSLFQMSVAGGVLILFIVVIRALAIHRLPKTTFLALWMIAALRLLLPFSIPLTFNIHIGLDVFSDVVQELPSGNIASTLPGDSPPSYDIGTAVPSPATEHISTFEILWLVGVLLLALYFFISYFRSMRKFRMSIPDNTPYIQNWLIAHQISRPLVVRSSDLISSPLTYGILHPVILLPKKLDRNDQAALKYVLTHEYVHIRRFDAITKILFAAVLCIHWFNPLVWVMYVLANRDMELSCDAWVIRMMGEKNRSSYALALISIEETRNSVSALCNYFSKNAITERIEAIMKYKKASTVAIALALVLVAGATTAFAASAAGALEPEVEVVQDGAAFGNTADIPAKDGSDKNGDVTLTPNSDNVFSGLAPHTENSVDATVTQADEGSKNLGNSGNSHLSVSAGKEFNIGKATWGKGQQITLFVESERENELEVGIKLVSTGKVYSETVKTGTGTVTLPIPEDGEYQIFVKNTSKSEADFSLGYMVNVP